MIVARTIPEMRITRAAARGRLGLVPTMGALHEGHRSCFAVARGACDVVVATIFVNPTQFGDPADLVGYPRTEMQDLAIAAEAGVDIVFVPSAAELYPSGFATTVDVGGVAEGFEGEHRPGHFRGVATICLKLFSIIQPHVAFFGQKDAQQVEVVKQMIRDLNLATTLAVVPTVRDAEGLALSSRNARLSPAERQRALAIPRALAAGVRARDRGEDVVAATKASLAGLDTDYVAVASFDGHPTLVIAARLGHTRLIDNVPLDQPALAGLTFEPDRKALSR